MNMQKIYAALMAVSLLAGCATGTESSSRKPVYSREEHSKMTLCIGMSDTAMFVATRKLRGAPKDALLKFYDGKEHSRLNKATVEKVYGDRFTYAWDYTVEFFSECALNLAGVERKRANLASYCAQNSMIANVAHAYKASGADKQRAYSHFSKLQSKTPNEIIDRVYASSKSRAELMLGEWNSCMSRLTAG